MEIGINDIDYGEYYEDYDETQDTGNFEETEEVVDNDLNSEQSNDFTDSDVISELLRSKGIEDRTRIKFENEDGDTEEYNWDDLTNDEKLNIINSQESVEDGFDNDELQLINAIRRSQMTPAEYLNYVQRVGINSYLQNAQQPTYKVDEFSDDELYVFDLLQKIGEDNITKEEAIEELNRAKSNEELFGKKIGAIREEYKKLENNRIYQEQANMQAIAQENYNKFAGQIANQINNFKGFSGLTLELDQEDKEELFDFITGMDDAGTSILGKAFNNPEILVSAAWFALNGQKIFNDINDYFSNEIKKSYRKGVEDAKSGKVRNGNKSQVVTKPRNINNQPQSSIDDLW